MDFDWNEMQKMLQTSAREFLNAQYPEKLLREMSHDTKGYTPELWAKLSEMGWTGLSIPEAYGGMGDYLDLIAVLEEMGRVCFIGPYFATLVSGASTILEAGNEDQKKQYLPEIASGKKLVTLALTEKMVGYTPEALQMPAILDKSEFVINGVKLFVPHAHSADYLVLAVRTSHTSDPEYGITLFIVDRQIQGIQSELLPTIDGDKLCRVSFANLRLSKENILGETDQGWRYLKKILAKAAIGRCAETMGACEKVLELTLAYAKERMAFGHPIGSYQSIQHRCADMLIDLESSRLITYRAAWLLSAGLPAWKETSIAKFWMNQAARRIATSAHQIHGAIGFTEDHLLHLYTKRIRTNEFSFGDVDHHLHALSVISS